MSTEADNNKKPWGPWRSVAVLVLVFLAVSIITWLILAPFIINSFYQNPSISYDDLFSQSSLIGSIVFSAGVIIALIWLVRRRMGSDWSGYFGFSGTSFATFMKWTVVILALVGVCDAVMIMLYEMGLIVRQMPISQKDFTSWTSWLLIVLFGPFQEELIFRGFLLEGFRKSRLGNVGAVLITSLIWAAGHYDGLAVAAFIFIPGVLYGIARIKTGSLYIPIAVHMLNNFLIGMLVIFWG